MSQVMKVWKWIQQEKQAEDVNGMWCKNGPEEKLCMVASSAMFICAKMVATWHITINNRSSKVKTLFFLFFFCCFLVYLVYHLEKKKTKKNLKFFTFLTFFLLLKVPWLPSPKKSDVLPDNSTVGSITLVLVKINGLVKSKDYSL